MQHHFSEDNKFSSFSSDSSEFFSESLTDLYDFPRNKIALHFSDSTTTNTNREICKAFWKYIDKDQTFNAIMEHGRFINKPDEKDIKITSVKKPKPVHICKLPPTKRLEEFVRLGMDKAAFPEKKNKNQSKERACLNFDDCGEPETDMKNDLKAFDDKVVAEPIIRYSKLLHSSPRQ